MKASTTAAYSNMILASPNPKISVIMPVRNVETFIKSAVESILNQKNASFELLVLDDQSSDSTIAIVESLGDTRIRIFRSEEHLGLSGQLNKGLSIARGEYIARMDGDDWAHPERLEQQVHFLEQHPNVGICGTFYMTINSQGKSLDKTATYYTNGVLKYRSFFRNPLCHPSVMFRKDLIKEIGSYRGANSEDYDLWIRAFSRTDFYVLPRILLHYRVHTQSFSVTEKFKQEAASLDLRQEHFRRFMQNAVSDSCLEFMLNNTMQLRQELTAEVLNTYEAFLQRLEQHEQLSDRDIFFINQEKALFYFSLFLNTKRGVAFNSFLKAYFSFPFFDRIAAAYIEQTYFYYFKNRLLPAWACLSISFIKSPLNKTNAILGFQLMKEMIRRVRRRATIFTI